MYRYTIFFIVTACAPKPASDTPAATPEPVADSDLGLSRTSVFDTPTPDAPTTSAGFPGSNEREAAYFSGSPSVIPHQVDAFLPITAQSNMCLGCHLQPAAMDQEPDAGKPPPIPSSHYTDLREDGATPGTTLVGARYGCDQCHARVTDAAPLVPNTYKQP